MSQGSINNSAELFKFIKENDFRIVSNIIFAGSPGHQISELDFFIRKFITGQVPSSLNYLWAQPKGPITEALATIYQPHFSKFKLRMMADDSLYEMANQIVRMKPEFAIDVGLSHIKDVTNEDSVLYSIHKPYHLVSNESVIRQYVDYFRLRTITADEPCWKDGRPDLDPRFRDFLGGPAAKLAIVHFRKGTGNAGVAMPVEHMLPTLAHLRDLGFTLVKIGLEPYPPAFAEYGVINYTDSEFCSFHNDIALLSHADLAIMHATGLANLVDILGTPILYYGQWHFHMPLFSERCVMVPALMHDPSRGRLVSFAEQMLWFRTRANFEIDKPLGWHFPLDRYVPRVPEADEMLAATRELLAIAAEPRPLTPAQAAFRMLDEHGQWRHSRARVSDQFLERFAGLF